MDFKELDFNSIIKMYQETKKEEKVTEMIILALDNYSDKKADSDYDFLNRRSLEYETIMRYKDNEKVLCLLARKNIHPIALVWDLISKKCDYSTIYGLVCKEIMPTKFLEDCVTKSKNPDLYAGVLFSNNVPDLDYKLLAFNFMGLDVTLDNEKYLNCIKAFLTKYPYIEEYYLPLAKIICTPNPKCVEVISEIIDYYLYNDSIDFEEIVKNRLDLRYLYEYCLSGKASFKYNASHFKYLNYLDELISKIKKLNIKNIAWALHIHKVSEKSRIDILNYWAMNNQVVAFDTYFKYFTSDTLDYENVGSLLDEEYSKKLAEEQPDTPMARKREKVFVPGFESHGQGLMDFN